MVLTLDSVAIRSSLLLTAAQRFQRDLGAPHGVSPLSSQSSYPGQNMDDGVATTWGPKNGARVTAITQTQQWIEGWLLASEKMSEARHDDPQTDATTEDL